MKQACAGLALLALLVPGDGGDTVVLENGRTLRGRVVYRDASRVVLRRDGRDSEIAAHEVARIESRLEGQAALLDNVERARLADPGAVELLAAQAEECGLDGEARALRSRMLRIDPVNEAAHLALGHRKRGEIWGVPLGGRNVSWDQRVALAREWGTAWEFSSLHFRLRSNLALDETLSALFDLERVYQFFYRLFGAELSLYELCEPMNVRLHADGASYPPTATPFGNYEPTADVVEIDAAHGLAFETLAHELTHQLLYNSAFRQHGQAGEIPPWLNEGLAEYVAASVTGEPGRRALEIGRSEPRHFRAHAGAHKPIELARILSLRSTDFQGEERELKYAEAYTLVHFLLHGSGEKHRAGFFEYLRLVYRGQGSGRDLERTVGTGRRLFEEAWHAYARNQKL